VISGRRLKESEAAGLGWLVADGIFTSIFVVEFVLKFILLTLAYFKDAWNRFDFALVIVGIFGLVMNILTQGGGAELAGQTRIMRLARVLRTMRFLRVFRLFHASLSRDKFVSLDLAKHLKKITTMSCFVLAHVMAQNDLVRYFGGNGKLDEVEETEIARCVLQSQVVTYRALVAAIATQRKIGGTVFNELKTLYQRKAISEGLTEFVEKAHADGAISATEAHAILHPLNHEVSACMKSLSDRAEGVVSRSSVEVDEAALKGLAHGKVKAAEAIEAPTIGKPEEAASAPGQVPENPDAQGMAPAKEAAPAAPVIEAPPA